MVREKRENWRDNMKRVVAGMEKGEGRYVDGRGKR